MEIMNYINVLMEYGSILLTIMAMLVFATNVIVEVIKGLIPVPTNVVTVVVAEVATIAAVAMACKALAITVSWCYTVGAVTLGLFVAYAAMFGFDKLKQVWRSINGEVQV